MNDIARRVASILPPRDDLTEGELIALADSVIGVALRVTGILRDEDPAEAGRLYEGLSEDRRWALPFAACAMLDYDKTPREMLGWAPACLPGRLAGATSVSPASVLLRSRPRPGRVLDCGTERAWQWHKDHGEEPCDACWVAHRAYEADKKAARRFLREAVSDPRVSQRAEKARAALAAVHALRESQMELFPAAAARQGRKPERERNADAA
jgi:hypothetical protein